LRDGQVPAFKLCLQKGVFYPENAMNEMSNTRADMKAGLFKCVESGLHRIENIWKAIGFGEELRCERMKDVFQHTQVSMCL
jgi:hypothetical protein